MAIKNRMLGLTSTINTHIYCYYRYSLIKEREVPTHLTDEEKIALHRLSKIINKNNCVVVEIGSYLGASSCFIANAIQNQKGRLYCIDTWQNQTMPEGERDTFSEFKKNTSKYKDTIVPLRGWSTIVVNEFEKLGERIDLFFVDGDHSYDACKLDWDSYRPFLAEKAIMIFHDTGWAEGVRKVIAESVANVADSILELPNMQAYRLR